MSRMDEVFARRRAVGQKVLVAYLCVGDPSVEESLLLARAALSAGADVLELGVPFSDPTADGPAIARASERAIAAGSSFAKTLDLAAEIRKTSAAPLVVFGYYNPLFVYGEERAVAAAKRAGVDAFLVVDLPPEEGATLRQAAAREGIAVVPLLTPTSNEARIAAATKQARGFLYYVSVTGVTGQAAETALEEAGRHAGRLRERSGLPVVVGFGIDSGIKARAATGLTAVPPCSAADGVVVGTAIVKAIEAAPDPAAREAAVRGVVASLRRALDEA